ncbi:FkbM family methyltransferase [Profundibacter sp.]
MSAIKRHITRSYLARQGAKHLEQYPQLACFAFDVITDSIHLDGRFEAEELEFLARSIFPQLKGRRTCLDVGANIGNHALFFADHFEQVIALEPNPRTYKLLDCNADLVENVTALPVGASDKEAVQVAYCYARNIGATSLETSADLAKEYNLKEVQFKLARLDDIPEVQAAKSIDFVKVDVEGHETACFEGAKETLKKHEPVIALEILGAQIENGQTPSLEVLKSCGYSHFYNLRSNRPLSRAPKPIAKLSTVFLGLFFNYRPPKSYTLEPLHLDSNRNYSMVLCSTYPLS